VEPIVTETLNSPDIIFLLQHAAKGLSENHERLGELDALAGDGDMGVTAELISKAIDLCMASPEADIGRLLMNCGMEINRRSPSTFGTLLASAFIEAGKAALGRKEIPVVDLAALGRSAVDGIRKRGKSDAGEKTMLDCIVPALDGFYSAISGGASIKVAIEATIEAAGAGTRNTTRMAATHGRASYRQDRSVGIQDAGATAICFMIESSGRALIGLINTRSKSTIT
jgi:dihydroxyacetone kinase-like protein